MKIVGIWQSTEDSLWKWTFTKDRKCIWEYDSETDSNFDYSLANTSPQCGIEVDVDQYTNYLKLIDIEDDEPYCYLINGITENYLSLTVVGRGGVTVFER